MTPLLSHTEVLPISAGVADVSSIFSVGAGSNSAGELSGAELEGWVDEIRISNVALAASKLLAVPEPVTAALGVLDALAVFGRRRRG